MFIHKPDILQTLLENFVNKAKLVILIFQVDDSHIITDECSNGTIDMNAC